MSILFPWLLVWMMVGLMFNHFFYTLTHKEINIAVIFIFYGPIFWMILLIVSLLSFIYHFVDFIYLDWKIYKNERGFGDNQ